MEVVGRQIAIQTAVALIVLSCAFPASGQTAHSREGESDAAAEVELQNAISLTRQGHFAEAIPHFIAVRGRVRDEYAASFNLALCYVGTSKYEQAIKVLDEIRFHGRTTPDVESLLAQAFIGAGKQEEAFAAAQKLAHLAPKNEKLFLLITDACMESGDYELGLKISELGLRELAGSARLLFEHGMFFAQLDQTDAAKRDLQRVMALAPHTDITYIASAQKSLFEGDVAQAVRVARDGITRGLQHFMLLTIYGEAVLRAGIGPGQPEFTEAQHALEKAVTEHANYASAQIALGKVLLMEGQVEDAIAHLETGRQLDPKNPAVYSNLAVAYRRHGDEKEAREMLDVLAKLNQQQAEKISTAPGETKRGYAASLPAEKPK